jgi:hypothetical protein
MRYRRITLLALLLLAACTDPFEGTHGVVDKREHQSAYTSVSCSTIGKTTTCTPIHHPETWRIHLVLGEDKGWARLRSQAEYDSAVEGVCWEVATRRPSKAGCLR